MAGAVATGRLALPWRPRLAIARGDLGLVPFLASLPLLYAPKVFEGDTQPWVLATAVLALLTYRPRAFMQRSDLAVIGLVAVAVAVYAARVGLTAETVRVAYIFLMFLVLWLLARRGGEDLFAAGIRFTLVVWFAVGLYQYVGTLLGHPVATVGRFLAERGGVPSLTAEPSYFGSLSVVMAMFLLHRQRRSDLAYIAIAVLSVLMSGSILAALLLVFPFLYLRPLLRLVAAGAVTGLVLIDAALNQAGLTARLAGLGSLGEGLIGILIDPSLNLRFGQIWFALWDNLLPELLLLSPASFEAQYNTFAGGVGYLIPTESDFILPMAGELIYDSGVFGLGVVALLVVAGGSGGATVGLRLLRGAFVAFCLLNPISIANPFLIFFCLQARRR